MRRERPNPFREFIKAIADAIRPHPEDAEWRKTHPTGRPWTPVNGPLSPDHQADHDPRF